MGCRSAGLSPAELTGSFPCWAKKSTYCSVSSYDFRFPLTAGLQAISPIPSAMNMTPDLIDIRIIWSPEKNIPIFIGEQDVTIEVWPLSPLIPGLCPTSFFT